MVDPHFNWSTLTHSHLAKFLYQLAPYVVDKELTSIDFHTIIKHHIKEYLPVIISKKYANDVAKDQIHIGGTYHYSFDKRNNKSIDILFVYNPDPIKIHLTRYRFSKVCSTFADTVLHEIIHMRQYRSRKFKSPHPYHSAINVKEQREEQCYLGCDDEIDAYAFNIACDFLKRYKGNTSKIIKHVNRLPTKKREYSESWKMYLAAFNYEIDHPIITKLKKKIVKHLDNAKHLDKPYKSSRWISQ